VLALRTYHGHKLPSVHTSLFTYSRRKGLRTTHGTLRCICRNRMRSRGLSNTPM